MIKKQILRRSLENPDKKSIFDAFIKLNTCGKPMDVAHIEKVKKMMNEL